MAEQSSISIIVPCLNEAGNIAGTVASIEEALRSSGRFSDYEILIFNDGSTDKTGAVADKLSGENEHISVINNARNMGFGYNYTEGVRRASKEFVIMVPGDNEIPTEAILACFTRVGDADIVVPYTANPGVRPLSRRWVSRLFVILMNMGFGLKLRYYNGTCVIKASLLKQVPMTTWGFAYMAAILVRLIRSGASYTEVGINIVQRTSGASKAFAPGNIISVLWAILKLFWEVRLRDRSRYSAVAGHTGSNAGLKG
jgi:glycosyltransferase involved in cell wall biosynthesis